ncbi:MAG: hypothetical protein R8K53_01910 [Mariprofundaceae bacterium]
MERKPKAKFGYNQHGAWSYYLPTAVFFLSVAFALSACDKTEQTPEAAPVMQASNVVQAPKFIEDTPLSQQIISYGKLSFINALAALDLNHDKRMDVADLQILRTQSNIKNHVGDLNHDGVSDVLDADLLSILIGNGSDMPIGLLDFNRDGVVTENDYRLPAIFSRVFQPFYSEQEAKSLMVSGARGYMYPVPATNLMYADLETRYVWDVYLEIPRLELKKRNDGVWMLEQGDASARAVHVSVSTPGGVISLHLSGKGMQAWSDGDMLIWGHFLWKFDGTSFHIEHAVAGDADKVSKSYNFLENISMLMIPPAFAEQSISPKLASEFNEYDAYVWENNSTLSRSLQELTDHLKTQPKCKTIDCSALKALIRDMDQLVDAASGAQTLATIGKKNAERIWEFQSHTVSAIRKGNNQVKRVLFWQKSALFAGDMAADLMDSLLTGNPTAIVDDLTNYGIGAGVDMLMSKSEFISSLSDSMGGIGTLSMEDGEIKFDPSSGSLDKVKHIHTVLTAKDPKEIRQAKLALTSIILKSILKASTSSALENTEKDLSNTSKALAEAKAFDRDMGMVVMLYAHAEKRLSKVRGRAQGQRQDMLSLLHDCEYQERKKSCTAELQTRLDQALSIREKVGGNAVKQERGKAAAVKLLEGKYQTALNNTKALQKKKHAASESIIKLIRATTLSNTDQMAEKRKRYDAKIKRLTVQQNEQWVNIKDLRKNLNEQRHQLSKLSQQNMQRKEQASDAYQKAVSDANSAFQKCLGSKGGFIPMRRIAKIISTAKDLIPPWLIYEAFVKVQSNMLNKVGSAKLWKDDPDCEKERPITAEPLNQISGCYYQFNAMSNTDTPGRMILDVRGASAQATIQYMKKTEGWDAENDREMTPVYEKYQMSFIGSYKQPWVELVHAYSKEDVIHLMGLEDWAVKSYEEENRFDILIRENGRMTQTLRMNDKREMRDHNDKWYDSSYFEIVGNRKDYLPSTSIFWEDRHQYRATDKAMDVDYLRETPDISEIKVTGADYKTPIKSVKNGDRIWISAISKKSCGIGHDKVFVQLKPVSRSMGCYPLSSNVALYETTPDSGEFHSDIAGIAMKCMAESLPGGWVAAESFLNGENFQGGLKYRSRNAPQVVSQPFAIVTSQGVVNKEP